jgi:DNA-binding GntR family transcriptional regulator
LRHKIISKELKPGQRLPEIGLAEEMQLSRTPVREAIRRLANEGLVILVPNSGARLASPSMEEMENAYEVREHLETLAVHKAASRITPLQLCRLEEAIQEEEKIFKERDIEAYLDVNVAFHEIIAEASGNVVLKEYIDNILSRTNVYMVFYESFFDFDTNPSLEEHRQLHEALRLKDPNLAVALMRRHIGLSMKSLAPHPPERAE